ncbi:hypothetical protein [Chitiniphilus eburneus]|uniref:Uncharacterized protein n=1 Tax=Chitiniphilus eburneus TaxID=2571148 RepID=A0A4U0Q5Y0_9NEIS|nr:hypothetical protein [Chitiniphilus eburneus]TJZ75592.1 hypothetical protein FAZ21_06670 [Chitiniphilus eburneus]
MLTDVPRPLFLGEIVAMLDFEFEAAEVASALVKLKREGKVVATLRQRNGPGRRLAMSYAVPDLALWSDRDSEDGEIRHICETPNEPDDLLRDSDDLVH